MQLDVIVMRPIDPWFRAMAAPDAAFAAFSACPKPREALPVQLNARTLRKPDRPAIEPIRPPPQDAGQPDARAEPHHFAAFGSAPICSAPPSRLPHALGHRPLSGARPPISFWSSSTRSQTPHTGAGGPHDLLGVFDLLLVIEFEQNAVVNQHDRHQTASVTPAGGQPQHLGRRLH